MVTVSPGRGNADWRSQDSVNVEYVGLYDYDYVDTRSRANIYVS